MILAVLLSVLDPWQEHMKQLIFLMYLCTEYFSKYLACVSHLIFSTELWKIFDYYCYLWDNKRLRNFSGSWKSKDIIQIQIQMVSLTSILLHTILKSYLSQAGLLHL